MERIAICNIDAAGHMNPVLALCQYLLKTGRVKSIRWYLFSSTHKAHLESTPNFSVCEVANLDPSALLKHMRKDPSDDVLPDLQQLLLPISMMVLPKTLEDLKSFQPQCMIYNPMLAYPIVAAQLLNIPCVSITTYSAFNQYPCFYTKVEDRTEEKRKQRLVHIKESFSVRKYNTMIKDSYGIDVLSNTLFGSHFLHTGLNICTGLKELSMEMPECVKDLYGDMDSKCVYVGPLLLEEGRVGSEFSKKGDFDKVLDAPFPIGDLVDAKDDGKRIVYVSFGTAVTGHFWEAGDCSSTFGNLTSGKEFSRTLWRRIFKAFGNKPNYLGVLAVVSTDPQALEGLEVPSNFIVRRKCPQLEILRYADAFIAHGGANGMMEAMAAKVPMLVLPFFCDQFENGQLVKALGLGLGYMDPLKETSASSIARDMEDLLNNPTFRVNCEKLRCKLVHAGGLEKAAQNLEDYVENFKGHALGASQNYEVSSLGPSHPVLKNKIIYI